MDGHHGYLGYFFGSTFQNSFFLPLLASFGMAGVITVVSELTFRRLRDKRAGDPGEGGATAARPARPGDRRPPVDPHA